jgi:hypothetical protein
MLFGSKKTPQVDLGDFEGEKEKLVSFLNSKLKVNVTCSQNKVTVDSEKVSPDELEHAVTKFFYHQHLNQTYYASTNGNTVKINRFKNVKKPEKPRKHGTSPTFAHGF